jgi:hypothetical protein
VPKVEVGLEQLAKALQELSPGDLETLEIMLDPGLAAELKSRREEAQREFREGRSLCREDLLDDERPVSSRRP